MTKSTVRFFGQLTVPENPVDLNGFEFHESDVVFSSSFDDISVVPSPSLSPSPSPSNVSRSPPIHRHYTSGLYAALSNEQNNSVRRKPNITPSQSAVTAAREVLPVTVRRTSEHYHQSAPVNVPVWPKNMSRKYLGQFDDVIDDDDDVDKDVGEEEMVPPHEIVARSYVTFSVFEGAGRTLKGRDLCRVRNAVFQKTGFLD